MNLNISKTKLWMTLGLSALAISTVTCGAGAMRYAAEEREARGMASPIWRRAIGAYSR